MTTLIFHVGENLEESEPESYIRGLLASKKCLLVQNILLKEELSFDQKKDAHTFWTECGHKIREKIKDDLRLENILRRVLPTYTGDGITLYRGENIERYKNKRIGFCWTTDIEKARMFARGLNSISSGGIVLEYCFDTNQIIAPPSEHSIYLGEYEYTIAPSTIILHSLITRDLYDSFY